MKSGGRFWFGFVKIKVCKRHFVKTEGEPSGRDRFRMHESHVLLGGTGGGWVSPGIMKT